MPQAKLPDMSANAHQAALLRCASLAAGIRSELETINAIPNDGYRAKATAGRLKAECVRSCISDPAMVWARGPLNGLYIELKTLTGSIFQIQKEWISKPKRYGYQATVCNGWAVDLSSDLDAEVSTPSHGDHLELPSIAIKPPLGFPGPHRQVNTATGLDLEVVRVHESEIDVKCFDRSTGECFAPIAPALNQKVLVDDRAKSSLAASDSWLKEMGQVPFINSTCHEAFVVSTNIPDLPSITTTARYDPPAPKLSLQLATRLNRSHQP